VGGIEKLEDGERWREMGADTEGGKGEEKGTTEGGGGIADRVGGRAEKAGRGNERGRGGARGPGESGRLDRKEGRLGVP